MARSIQSRAAERVLEVMHDVVCVPKGECVLVSRHGRCAYLMPETVLELSDKDIVTLVESMMDAGRRLP
ncbi:MAG: hypothetical protein ABFC80_05480 [Coriobacteriales bacterium]